MESIGKFPGLKLIIFSTDMRKNFTTQRIREKKMPSNKGPLPESIAPSPKTSPPSTKRKNLEDARKLAEMLQEQFPGSPVGKKYLQQAPQSTSPPQEEREKKMPSNKKPLSTSIAPLPKNLPPSTKKSQGFKDAQTLAKRLKEKFPDSPEGKKYLPETPKAAPQGIELPTAEKVAGMSDEEIEAYVDQLIAAGVAPTDF